MLAIRMQRTGRRGHASFRLVVQDSRQSPMSGKVVARLGSYDPHTKSVVLEKDRASEFLKNGAQPSERVAKLLKQEGVKLPEWVEATAKKKSTIRNPEKLRRNRPKDAKPAEPKEEIKQEAPAEAVTDTEATDSEAPSEKPEETTESVAENTDDAAEEKTETADPETEKPVE